MWESKMHMVYGTAWKKEETARLVEEAVTTGFRFIDTACQPKHYNEAGVGEGWYRAALKLGIDRSEMCKCRCIFRLLMLIYLQI